MVTYLLKPRRDKKISKSKWQHGHDSNKEFGLKYVIKSDYVEADEK